MKSEIDNISCSRAWINISLENLENNIGEIRKLLNYSSDIMAVVKANAYGHGIELVSKKLASIGIKYFAVATLDEAITLRKNGIKGEILILGYTDFSSLKYVVEYDLMQTVIDYNYSLGISNLKLKEKLKVHVAINTGMNRIGENFNNLKEICKIYDNPILDIRGIYSHLCVSDSAKEDDKDYTLKQIERFKGVIDFLQRNGFKTGKTHIMASYGIINYNDYKFDLVRVGIIMYGVNSSKDSYCKEKVNLKKVLLSIKARVTSIKTIEKGEAVSYGRCFISPKKMVIASISIGYADGIPRDLYSKNYYVKVNNKYAKIVGRICMDQLMIDITDIENVKIGDIVSVVDSEDDVSSIENMAYVENTITNELLCNLGSRLKRIVK